MAKPQDPQMFDGEPPMQSNQGDSIPPLDYDPKKLLKHKPTPKQQKQAKAKEAKQAKTPRSQSNQPDKQSQSTQQSKSVASKPSSMASQKSVKLHTAKPIQTDKQIHQVTNKVNQASQTRQKQMKRFKKIQHEYEVRREDLIKPPHLDKDKLQKAPTKQLKQIALNYHKQIAKALKILKPRSKDFKEGRILDGKLLRHEIDFTQIKLYQQKSIITYHKWQNKAQAIQQKDTDFDNHIKSIIKPRLEKYYQSITVDKANQLLQRLADKQKAQLKKPTADVMKYGKFYTAKSKRGQQLKSFQYKEAKAYQKYENQIKANQKQFQNQKNKYAKIIKHNAQLKKQKLVQKPKMLRHQHEHIKQPTKSEIQAYRHKQIIKAQAKLTDQLREAHKQDQQNSKIYKVLHSGFLSISNNWHLKQQRLHDLRRQYIEKRQLVDKAYIHGNIQDKKYIYTFSDEELDNTHKALTMRYHIKKANPQIQTEKQLQDYCVRAFNKDYPQYKNAQQIMSNHSNLNATQAEQYRHQKFMQSQDSIPVDEGMQHITHIYNYYQGTALNQTKENVSNANQSERLSNLKTNRSQTGKFNRFLTYAQQRAKFCCKCISTSPAFTRLAKKIGYHEQPITKQAVMPIKSKKQTQSLTWKDKIKRWSQEQQKETIARRHFGFKTVANLHNIYEAKKQGMAYSQYETPQTEVISKSYQQYKSHPIQAKMHTQPLKHHNMISKMRKKAKASMKKVERHNKPKKTKSEIQRHLKQNNSERER